MRDSANEVTTKPVNGIAGAPDGHVRFNRGVGGAALRGVNDINLILCASLECSSGVQTCTAGCDRTVEDRLLKLGEIVWPGTARQRHGHSENRTSKV